MLDLVSQVHDAILMSVYLDVGNPRGSGFWNEGYMSKGREMESCPEFKITMSFPYAHGPEKR